MVTFYNTYKYMMEWNENHDSRKYFYASSFYLEWMSSLAIKACDLVVSRDTGSLRGASFLQDCRELKRRRFEFVEPKTTSFSPKIFFSKTMSFWENTFLGLNDVILDSLQPYRKLTHRRKTLSRVECHPYLITLIVIRYLLWLGDILGNPYLITLNDIRYPPIG